MYPKISLIIYTDDTESEVVLDISERADAVTVETDRHGYGTLNAAVSGLNKWELYRLFTYSPLLHVVASAGPVRIFEGRIEDRPMTQGNWQFAAFGYHRVYSDVAYSALWSTKSWSVWKKLTPDDTSGVEPSLWAMDNSGRLHIAPRVGETFGNGVDIGSYAYSFGNWSSRKTKKVDITYSGTLPSSWTFAVGELDGPPMTNLTVVTTNTTWPKTSTTNSYTLGDQDGVYLSVYAGASNNTPTGDTGDHYVTIESYRLKTTTSTSVLGDEIVSAMITHVNSKNAGAASTDTSWIQSPGVDLEEVQWRNERPGDIMTELCGIGDSSIPPKPWQWRVWENRVLRFEPRDEPADQLEFFLTNPDFYIDSSLDEMYNSVAGIYQGGRWPKITDPDTDATSITEFGITREKIISGRDLSDAAVRQEAVLGESKDVIPHARIKTTLLYQANAQPCPLFAIRSGDKITMRDFTPGGVEIVDKFRTFVVSRTILDVTNGELTIIPESDVASLVRAIASLGKTTDPRDSGGPVETSGPGVPIPQ